MPICSERLRQQKEISMTMSDIKDVDTQLNRQYRRSESIASSGDKQAVSMATKTQEKFVCYATLMEIGQAKGDVSKVLDVRDARVREIKDRVERGLYDVRGEQIARKMVRESIMNLFWLDLGIKSCVVLPFPV